MAHLEKQLNAKKEEETANEADKIDVEEKFENQNFKKMKQQIEDEENPDVLAASDLDSALDKMNLDDDDKHPEKRMKTAWQVFYDRRLPELQAEFPALKHSQLHQKIHKEFQKSPENPVYMKKIKEKD